MENNLESYLAAIEAQLNDVPAARKIEFMDEVRAHLHAMVEAKRADGADAATAWLHSMCEFGEPEKVGRDLRKQWVDSAQMENEGAPLSAREIVRKFGFSLVLGVMGALAFSVFGLPTASHGPLVVPAVALFLFLALGRGLYAQHRQLGGWTPSAIVGIIFIATINLYVLSFLQWGNDWAIGVIGASGGIPVYFVFALMALQKWLARREISQRPWQFTSRFKSSPVAAEQEHRLMPVIGMGMGLIFSFLLAIPASLQVFGLPVLWIVCAIIIVAVALCAWQLRK